SVCNYADPNVFFGTTIVFPNSVARGTARGLDLRHVASASGSWVQPVGAWSASARARYASGTPVELGDLDDDEAAALASRPGAHLIDLDRGRVKPRLVVDVTTSRRLRCTSWGAVTVRASVQNAFGRAYAFNFGNPFSGTHFGAPLTFRLDAQLTFD
ncbi:MAG: hypothetical protein ABI880_07440, partial [Acidobacteriota bacterium]